MSSKEIDLTCPCCAARLTVDVATGRLMRARNAAGETVSGASTDRWASAQEQVRQRTASGADKLESALENERGKAQRLDELFRKAQARQRRGEEDDPA